MTFLQMARKQIEGNRIGFPLPGRILSRQQMAGRGRYEQLTQGAASWSFSSDFYLSVAVAVAFSFAHELVQLVCLLLASLVSQSHTDQEQGTVLMAITPICTLVTHAYLLCIKGRTST